jgi:hypothetical protein
MTPVATGVAIMTYEQAAQIALESAQKDGLVRWVYRAKASWPASEEWRVTIHYGEIGQGAPSTRIVPQDREIPTKPE